MKLAIRTAIVALSIVLVGAFAGTASPQPLAPPGKIENFVAAGHKPVPSAVVQQKVVGNTVYTLHLDDYQGARRGDTSAVFYPSGDRMTIRLIDGKTTVRGTWWADGDKTCYRFRIQTDVVGCAQWFDVGDVIYSCHVSGGACRTLIRIVPGNPENL